MSTDAEFLEKLRSLHFARPSKRGPKVTTDVHDAHKVHVTEHWDDRVGVNVVLDKPLTTDARVSPKENHGDG